MKSDERWMMEIFNGFRIEADKNQKSSAFASDNHFIHPENIGNLHSSCGNLYFAGGNDEYFGCEDIEVWGLN